MLSDWIDETKKENNNFPKKISIYCLKNNEKVEKNEEIENIAKKILIGLVNPEYLKHCCDGESKKEIISFIEEYYIPHENKKIIGKPKQSMWGEIITGEILEELRNHTLPLYHLRDKEKRDFAMRGKNDVVTICPMKYGEKLKISFTEVKTHGDIKTSGIYNFKKSMKKAKNSIEKSNEVKPEIIEHIHNILFEKNMSPEMLSIFDEAVRKPNSYDREFHIFLIMEKHRWKNSIIEFFKEETLDLTNLTLNIFLIDSIDDLIEKTYDNVSVTTSTS